MGNLTIELELVNNDLDCIINPDDYAEDDGALHADINARFTRDVALPAGGDTNTSDFLNLATLLFCVVFAPLIIQTTNMFSIF